VSNFDAPSIHQMATAALEFVVHRSLLWYTVPAAASAVLLLGASLLKDAEERRARGWRARRRDVLYLVAVAVFLLAQRWPALVIGDLDGDESVAVSAALTRYLHPAYGLTLFTGSAGPLLTYPVSVLGLLGFRIDYGAAKLMVQLLMTASSAVMYLALRTISDGRIARIALLPLLAFLGLGNPYWMQSYCSEHWINLLAISMIYFLERLDQGAGREGVNLACIGLALGLMPLVKWQGMPMAALFTLIAFTIVARRCVREGVGLGELARRTLPLAVPALAPLLLWCAILWSFDALGYFYATYFSALFTQATGRFESTFLERLTSFPNWGISPLLVPPFFLYGTAAFGLPAAMYVCFRTRARRHRLDLALATLYLVVSAYAVFQPGGQFAHYLNLLSQPYFLICMLLFCRAVTVAPRAGIVVSGYLGLALLLPTLACVRRAPLPVRIRPVNLRARVDAAVREVAPPGSRMILWGWDYFHYVYTGMTWGTRTGGSHEILEPFFRDKNVFVQDYVESLESGRAPVFLDTATQGSYHYDDPARYGHATRPEIARAVRDSYFLCARFRGASIYLQRRTYAGRPEIRAWCSKLRRGMA
jgi:hypothetical protein